MKNKVLIFITIILILMLSACSKPELTSVTEFADEGFYLINYLEEIDSSETMKSEFEKKYKAYNLTGVQKEYYVSSLKCYHLMIVMEKEDTFESYDSYKKEKDNATRLYNILSQEVE